MASPARAQPAAEPAHDFVEDYLLYLLARASMEASAQFHAIVKRKGLSVLEWRVLGQLAGGPATVGLLAERALSQQPTLTGVLDRMAADGLVVRLGGRTADRHRVLLRLTEKGRRLMRRARCRWRAHEARVLASYSARKAAA
ncbi:MAG: MarR family transcriptional regulator [Alphaproteobacteria bacterium]